MKFYRIVVTIIGFILLGFLLFSVSAEPVYLVGVGDYDYFPHHGVSNGEYTGYAREVLDLFSEKSGYRFKYMQLPWKRLVRKYVRGELDFVYPDNKVWDLQIKGKTKILYSDSVVSYIDGLILLPENKGKGVDKLRSIATIRGFTVWDFHDQIQSGEIKLIESDNYIPLLRLVLLGRVDAAYTELSVANYYLREKLNMENKLVFDQDLPYTKDNYSLSSIKHMEIIKEFNEFLKSEKETLDLLKTKYNIIDVNGINR